MGMSGICRCKNFVLGKHVEGSFDNFESLNAKMINQIIIWVVNGILGEQF